MITATSVRTLVPGTTEPVMVVSPLATWTAVPAAATIAVNRTAVPSAVSQPKKGGTDLHAAERCLLPRDHTAPVDGGGLIAHSLVAQALVREVEVPARRVLHGHLQQEPATIGCSADTQGEAR
jgi:hypothetical protein